MPAGKRPPRTGEALAKLKVTQKRYYEKQKAAGKKRTYKRRTGSALLRQKESQKISKKRKRRENALAKAQQEQQEPNDQQVEDPKDHPGAAEEPIGVVRPANPKVYNRKNKVTTLGQHTNNPHEGRMFEVMNRKLNS